MVAKSCRARCSGPFPCVPFPRNHSAGPQAASNIAEKSPQGSCSCLAEAVPPLRASINNPALLAFRLWRQKPGNTAVPTPLPRGTRSLEHLLTFQRARIALEKKARTTNVIEPPFLEVRRRTHPSMSGFFQYAAANATQLIYGSSRT